jgi:hypothetical protein
MEKEMNNEAPFGRNKMYNDIYAKLSPAKRKEYMRTVQRVREINSTVLAIVKKAHGRDRELLISDKGFNEWCRLLFIDLEAEFKNIRKKTKAILKIQQDKVSFKGQSYTMNASAEEADYITAIIVDMEGLIHPYSYKLWLSHIYKTKKKSKVKKKSTSRKSVREGVCIQTKSVRDYILE